MMCTEGLCKKMMRKKYLDPIQREEWLRALEKKSTGVIDLLESYVWGIPYHRESPH